MALEAVDGVAGATSWRGENVLSFGTWRKKDIYICMQKSNYQSLKNRRHQRHINQRAPKTSKGQNETKEIVTAI